MDRPAAVAGQWYPADRVRLGRQVDEYLTAAELDPLPHHIRAIVAPHAGLMYSGPVAAYAYKLLRDQQYRAAVMVGPSHFVGFRGVSIWPGGRWQTPFGPVQVEPALAGVIARHGKDVVERPDAHGREHSLEMQMPFVAHLLPGVPIVPLVMGYQTRETALALGGALASAIREWAPDDPGSVVLIASSDLSHYEDAPTAAAMGAVVTAAVDALDPDGLMDALEREPRHACGGGPMVAVMHAARQLGAAHARVLRYADSGDVSGDKSAVVGYMAAAIW